MGEARRKRLVGNAEPSNPNWKRRPRKFTRKDEVELQMEIMAKMLGLYPRFPIDSMELRTMRTGGLR